MRAQRMAQSPLPARTFAAMTFADIAQMIAALAVTLGFFGLGVWALRKYGPEFTRKLSAARGDRRLRVGFASYFFRDGTAGRLNFMGRL